MFANPVFITPGRIKKGSKATFKPHQTGRIFDRLKNLTVHFVHTGPFKIFAFFTRNFERLGVYISVRLSSFRVNLSAQIFNRSKIRPVPGERTLNHNISLVLF